jgi:hypothetical protein
LNPDAKWFMEKADSPDWSEQEALLLRHEAFMAEIARRRARLEAKDGSKPRWQRFLETSGGTALVTVLLGGLMGQLITWSIQNQLKEREFQQAWMKARGDQALVTYKEYLDQEQEIVKRSYELIGGCISASEDLILLTTPDFAPGDFSGSEKHKVETERSSIVEKYNSADSQWRSEREKLGLMMSYYHRGRPEVTRAWQEIQSSVTKYNDCAGRWYLQHPLPISTESACGEELTELRKRLDQLSSNLEAARQYAWEGWESPEKLRTALEKQ